MFESTIVAAQWRFSLERATSKTELGFRKDGEGA